MTPGPHMTRWARARRPHVRRPYVRRPCARRPRTRPSFVGVVALALLAWLTAPEEIDARRKRPPAPPPLAIVNVTPSPVPFIPGPESSLTLTVTVELPDSLGGAEIIEVSSLIGSPSERSIRFVVDRQTLDDVVMEDGKPLKRITLIWDGKDQHRRYVRPGTYAYAVRAKLMVEQNGFLQATTVSRFERGTLNVAPPPEAAVEPSTVVTTPTTVTPPTPPAPVDAGAPPPVTSPPRSDSAPSTDTDTDAGASANPRTPDDARPNAAGQPSDDAT